MPKKAILTVVISENFIDILLSGLEIDKIKRLQATVQSTGLKLENMGIDGDIIVKSKTGTQDQTKLKLNTKFADNDVILNHSLFKILITSTLFSRSIDAIKK